MNNDINQETEQSALTEKHLQGAHQAISKIRSRITQIVQGQQEVVDQVLIAMLSGGHVLIEGVPGLGKTLLVRALADCFNGDFKRIQFTPDLMPADITGHVLYNMKDGEFNVRRGPVFTNLLLADEINRSPAKTQAALLEVMQDHQVTLDGEPHALPKPFMVLATQNPIEQEGTYPLPEAELDRFVMKVFIKYPSQEDEIKLTKMVTAETRDDGLLQQSSPIVSPDAIVKLQKMVPKITVDDEVMAYAVRLVRATRENTAIINGAGPRASIALIRCARANALMRGDNFVLPDDVKAMALPVMRHRIILAADVEMEGLSTDYVLEQLLDNIEAPRL